jgi:hypothetical protein
MLAPYDSAPDVAVDAAAAEPLTRVAFGFFAAAIASATS